MRNSILTILILITFFTSKGQTPSPYKPAPNAVSSNTSVPAAKKFTVKGKVIESVTATPMGYANVAIFSAADSTVAGGIMTADNGSFEIKNLLPGRYYLSVNFIGYAKKTIPLQIAATKPITDIGTIKLITTDVGDWL